MIYPTTIVVMPCDTCVANVGSSCIAWSDWLCMSMKPGARTRPRALIISASGGGVSGRTETM